MKHFASIEKIDTAILYLLELASSISVLLLAFGLIASMANVLTKGSVLTDNLTMQHIWAWTQCIAIDASVAPSIIRFYQYARQEERLKASLYGLLSLLLLFTAAIVSNIESVQQTLNLVLEAAYQHVFVPVETLIWIRSLTIVFLIVAHALRHVHSEDELPAQTMTIATPSLVLTPELVESLRVALAHVTVSQEAEQPLLAQPNANMTQEQKAIADQEGKQEANNGERVNAYLTVHPNATDRDIAEALQISVSTAHKWRRRLLEEARVDIV